MDKKNSLAPVSLFGLPMVHYLDPALRYEETGKRK